MVSRDTPALKLVESNVPTLRMPPVDQGQVDPPSRRAPRAEERKRRGSPILQLQLMPLSGTGCHRIGYNIVAFNATAGSIAWSSLKERGRV